MRSFYLTGSAAIIAIQVLAATPVTAQAPARQVYHLPEQTLATALREVARRSGLSVAAAADLLAGKRVGPLDGEYTAQEAIDVLLIDTGLVARRTDDGVIIARRDDIAAAAGDQGEVTVTGTRIRGSRQASPVITLSRQAMEDQGKSDLGAVVRALPQSFGGGQNPGLGINVPAGSGVDVGGGSSINLRGLGSDATLTLLDGRRMAFNASRQSIDVSAIPFGAVERIEIVPDGASAIYGSDAVAGVANVILRRRLDGVEFGGRIGAASDGGYFQQQFWATGGQSWNGGNAVISFDRGTNSAVFGAQRSYAASKPGLTLFPALRHASGSLAGQQEIVSGLTLELDGLFNTRASRTRLPTSPTGDIRLGRSVSDFATRSWVLAPSLKLALADGWRLILAGDVGGERIRAVQTTCTATSCAQSGRGSYHNTAKSIEISGDGPLFRLPGGEAKLATGAGYRKIGFERDQLNGTAVNARHSQASYYAFGEIELPLVGAEQDLPLVDRLTATAAVRYERYPGIGGVPTPKLGLIWSPIRDVTLKGSWGRSFKAPTQYQQYVPRVGIIYPPASLGGSGFPAGSGVLYYQGGNPDLEPERARTWSTTLAFAPRSLPGAALEVSYFNVSYRDRIVAPVAFLSQALTNPLYAAQVIRNPSAAQQAALIANFASLINITGVPYNPANIVAIVDNANVNAGRQSARGVDILARYRLDLGQERSLAASANASYLKSDQQLSASQPVIPLAGRIFSPPHWRGQGTLTYASPSLTLAATLNVIGGVLDARRAVAVPIDGMTTLDLVARVRVARPPLLRGLELGVSAGNVFNAKPALIVSPAITDTPYDSTNYSPLGRVLSVSMRGSF